MGTLCNTSSKLCMPGLNLFYLRIYIISLLYEFVCVCVLRLYCICNKMLLWTIYEIYDMISYYVNIISTHDYKR